MHVCCVRWGASGGGSSRRRRHCCSGSTSAAVHWPTCTASRPPCGPSRVSWTKPCRASRTRSGQVWTGMILGMSSPDEERADGAMAGDPAAGVCGACATGAVGRVGGRGTSYGRTSGEQAASCHAWTVSQTSIGWILAPTMSRYASTCRRTCGRSKSQASKSQKAGLSVCTRPQRKGGGRTNPKVQSTRSGKWTPGRGGCRASASMSASGGGPQEGPAHGPLRQLTEVWVSADRAHMLQKPRQPPHIVHRG